jgi:hypothetical protein
MIGALMALSPQVDRSGPSACIRQALPAAIDSAGEAPFGPRKFEFAATPSLDYPSRAWVVQLVDQGADGGALRIMRLRVQSGCNRYDIAQRWDARIAQESVNTLTTSLTAFGLPPATIFIPEATGELAISFLDDTSLTLRLSTTEWKVSRTLSQGDHAGRALSKIMHRLVAEHIPAGDIPSDDW